MADCVEDTRYRQVTTRRPRRPVRSPGRVATRARPRDARPFADSAGRHASRYPRVAVTLIEVNSSSVRAERGTPAARSAVVPHHLAVAAAGSGKRNEGQMTADEGTAANRNLSTGSDVCRDGRSKALDNRLGGTSVPDTLAGVFGTPDRGPHDGPRRAW
jgi:hypothetical protein